EGLAVTSQVWEAPRKVMALVHATEIPCAERACKVTCLHVIHVLGDMEVGREKCVHEEEVCSFKMLRGLFGEPQGCVGGIPNPHAVGLQQNPTGVRGRMVHGEKRALHPEEGERAICPDRVAIAKEKLEDPPA